MKVRFVLVRPRNPLNIGAAARGMANFGFDDMVVVKPYAPVWRELTSAVGAERLMLAARSVDGLPDAVEGCQLVLGTTAVRDRNLQRPVVRLPELGAFLKERGVERAAILFGSEKTGLSNTHLERCHAYLTVPTSMEQPSMNLSHAVTVVGYELARAREDLGAPSRELPPAQAADVDQLVTHTLALFKKAGFLSCLPERKQAEKIRRSFLNWRLRVTDVQLMHGIMRFMENRIGGARPSATSTGRGARG
jgi:tRNA/rRNA methyltransferase